MFCDALWTLCGISGATPEMTHKLENATKNATQEHQHKRNRQGLRHLSFTVPAHAGNAGQAG